MLPKDFPPWKTVYWWFWGFVRLMLFRTIHDIALMMDRERAGREASPSAAWSTASRSRRQLVRDYGQRVDVSEARTHVAMGSLLLRRISH